MDLQDRTVFGFEALPRGPMRDDPRALPALPSRGPLHEPRPPCLCPWPQRSSRTRSSTRSQGRRGRGVARRGGVADRRGDRARDAGAHQPADGAAARQGVPGRPRRGRPRGCSSAGAVADLLPNFVFLDPELHRLRLDAASGHAPSSPACSPTALASTRHVVPRGHRRRRHGP